MPVLTNRNCIGGIINGMSMHSNTKSKMTVVDYVDTAGIGRRLLAYRQAGLSYRGRSPCLSKPKEKSAEVIVVADTSCALTIDNTEVSPKQRRTEHLYT